MNVYGVTSPHIPVSDRASNYGDGCFTTIAVSSARAEFLTHHLSRLEEGCKVLHIPFIQWDSLQSMITEQASDLTEGVIKVIVSRGSGGRGYSPQGCEEPTVVITRHAMPGHYPTLRQQGVTLGLSTFQLARQPILAGIKHLNRLEQVLIKAGMAQTNHEDCVVTDTEGFVVETSAANLFWRKGETWFTPELGHAGVSGVMRRCIKEFLDSQDVSCYEVSVKPENLHCADEMLICNSLLGAVPVTEFHSQDAVSTRYPINFVRTIQQWLQSVCHD